MTMNDNQARTCKWLIVCAGAIIITLTICVTCHNVAAMKMPIGLKVDMMNAGYIQEMHPDKMVEKK